MEEIAGLLETRIKGLPIQSVEKRSDFHLENYLAYTIVSACATVLIIIGLAAYRVFLADQGVAAHHNSDSDAQAL